MVAIYNIIWSNSRYFREILGMTPQEGHNYPVLVFSVIGNFVLLLRWLPDGGLSKPFIALLAVLFCVPPTVMGYTDQPFYSGVGVGVLPVLVFAVVDHWHPPHTANEIQNILNGSVFWAGMALPVATFLFAVGVLIQTRSLLPWYDRGKHDSSYPSGIYSIRGGCLRGCLYPVLCGF